MRNALIALLIEKFPDLIETVKGWYAEAHPGAPIPTSAEVIEAWLLASANSIVIDDDWLALHPED